MDLSIVHKISAALGCDENILTKQIAESRKKPSVQGAEKS